MTPNISFGILTVLTIISLIVLIIIVHDEINLPEKKRTKKIIHTCATGSIRGIIMGVVTSSGFNNALINGYIFAVVAPVMIFLEGLIT